jgi:hypothetical protein
LSTADLGIRIFLQDSASAGLGAFGGTLGRVGYQIGSLMSYWNQLSPAMRGTAIIAASSGVAFAGFAGAMGGTVDAASQLEEALTNVQIAFNLTDQQISQFKPLLIDLADNSRFTAQEVSDGFSTMGEYGAKFSTIMDKSVGQSMINFAEATGSQVVPAAKLLASTIQTFQLPFSQASHVADLLTSAFYNGVPSISQLQDALGQAGPAAKQLGISLDDLLPYLSYLSQQMKSGSSAGTALANVFKAISSPTAGAAKEMAALGLTTVQTTPALLQLLDATNAVSKTPVQLDGTLAGLQRLYTAAEKVGTLHTDQTLIQWATSSGFLSSSLYNAQGNFLGFDNFLEQLETHFEQLKLTPLEVGQALGAMFNRTALNAIKDLIDNSGQANDKIKLLKQAFEEGGTAAQRAADKNDTYAGRLAELTTTFKNFAALIGAPLANDLKNLYNDLNNLLGPIVAMLNKNPELAHFAASFLLVGAGVSGLTFAVSGLSFVFGIASKHAGSMVNDVGAAFNGLKGLLSGSLSGVGDIILQAFSPVLKLRGMLSNIITPDVIINAFKNLDLVSGLKGAFSALHSFIGNATMSIMQTALKGFLGMGNLLGNLGPSLLSGAKSAFSLLDNFIGGAAVNLMQAMTKGFLSIGPVTGRILASIPAIAAQTGALLANAAAWLLVNWPILVVVAAIAILIGAFYVLVQHLGGLQGLLKLFAPILQPLASTFSSIGKEIQSSLGQAIKQLQPAWQQLVQSFQQAKPALLVIGAIFGGVILVAIGLFLAGLVGLARAIGPILGGVIRFVAGMLQVVMGVFQILISLFNLVVGLLTGNTKLINSALNGMKQGALNIFHGLVSGIIGLFAGLWGGIVGFVSGFVNGFINFIKHLYDQIVGHSLIPDLVNGIIRWITQLPAKIPALISSMVTSLLSSIASLVTQGVAHFQQFVSQGVSWIENLRSQLVNKFNQLLSQGPAILRSMEVQIGYIIIGLVNNAINTAASLPGRLAGIFNSAKSMAAGAIAGLGPMLAASGYNAISMLVGSLLAGVGRVASAAASLAGSIASHLGFHSPPKTGPLADSHLYMPNFINMLSTGLIAGRSKLTSAASSLASGLSSSIQPTLSPAFAGGKKETHVHIHLDSKEIGTAVLDDLTSQMKMNGVGRLYR